MYDIGDICNKYFFSYILIIDSIIKFTFYTNFNNIFIGRKKVKFKIDIK